MDHENPQVPWTEEQWRTVRTAVQEAARKARVASSFLPLEGPLPDSVTTVPRLLLEDKGLETRQRGEAEKYLEVDTTAVLSLTTVAAHVYVKTSQVHDPDLSAAIAMLCRAASVVARVEDSIVFRGQTDVNQEPEPKTQPEICTVRHGNVGKGLLDKGENGEREIRIDLAGTPGNRLVDAVNRAINELEGNGHFGPFACVLGHALFAEANAPNANSLVLPSDRIKPFLNGPLLRSSTIRPVGVPKPDEEQLGVVISLAGSPIELVVGSDIDVKFLQVNVEPRYVFRVSERFVLRAKVPDAVRVLSLTSQGEKKGQR